MEKFNFNELFNLKEKSVEAGKNYFECKKTFVKLFKSKPDWMRFLKHYVTIYDKSEAWFARTERMVSIDIEIGEKPNTIRISWINNIGDYDNDEFKTRDIPIEKLEQFLYSEDFFSEIDARLQRMKKYKEEKMKKFQEEQERKMYERLKAKFETI